MYSVFAIEYTNLTYVDLDVSKDATGIWASVTMGEFLVVVEVEIAI